LQHLDRDIYSLSANDFYDITSGSNGYATLQGYDMVTGRGSPKATVLVHDLIAVGDQVTVITSPPIVISPVSAASTNPGTSPTSNPVATTGNTSAKVMPSDPVSPFATSTDNTKVVVSPEYLASTYSSNPARKLDLSDLLSAARNNAEVDGLIDALFASYDFA
jgi:ABC-type xylose transport system substrate-binding protein